MSSPAGAEENQIRSMVDATHMTHMTPVPQMTPVVWPRGVWAWGVWAWGSQGGAADPMDSPVLGFVTPTDSPVLGFLAPEHDSR